MTGAMAAWLWQEVVRPSWLSLISAPFVLAGYWLLGQRRRAGWWFVIVSQAGLLAIALADRQYGLVVVLVLIWQAYRNWRRWGRAPGAAA
jgi:nicotinamide riboside transporter PnuC